MSAQDIKVRSQQGMMLIMLVFIAGMAAMAFVLHALNVNTVKIERDKRTVAALAEAKAALIGRAATDSNRPGSLPCPDNDDNGSADLFTGNNCPVYMGRFPWKTLGTGVLEDGSGEKLWYAMATNYRDHPAVEPLNGTAPGSLSVDGMSDQVAIIFSPGSPLSTQTSRPSNHVTDYLEGENADGDVEFTQQASPTQNDRLITISRAELFSPVAQRMLREIRGDTTQGMLKYYACHSVLAYADQGGDGVADGMKLFGRPSFSGDLNCPTSNPSLPFVAGTKQMLLNNGWFSLIGYTVSSDLMTGTLVLNGKTLTVSP